MSDINAQILLYVANNNTKCVYFTQSNATSLTLNMLTYDLLINKVQAKLQLLSCDTLRNSAILDNIASSSVGSCDAYTSWVDAFNEDFDYSCRRILQAPFELVLELIKLRYDVFNLAASGHALIVDELDLPLA